MNFHQNIAPLAVLLIAVTVIASGCQPYGSAHAKQARTMRQCGTISMINARFALIGGDLDSALNHFKQANRLATSCRKADMQADALLWIGRTQLYSMKLEEAEQSLQQAIFLSEGTRRKDVTRDALCFLAVAHYASKHNRAALEAIYNAELITIDDSPLMCYQIVRKGQYGGLLPPTIREAILSIPY